MKTAIVTGANGNLGQAIVKKFTGENYRVFGTVLGTEQYDNGFETGNFKAVPVDLLSEQASHQFTAQVIEQCGSIDTAVLTVGGFAAGNITGTSTADILKQYKLNFETTYNIARPVFLQMLKQNSGRIFFIGARPGLNAEMSKGMTAYGLAKSLVMRLAEIMNAEAKGYNVTVSVVIPSTIDTEVNRKAMPEADFSSWVQPGEIADIIYFHTTEQARSIRETVIKVYGNS